MRILFGILAVILIPTSTGLGTWMTWDLFRKPKTNNIPSDYLLWGVVILPCIALLVLGVFIAYHTVKNDLGEPDPCAYTVMVGKVPVTHYRHGRIIYGGREVICP